MRALDSDRVGAAAHVGASEGGQGAPGAPRGGGAALFPLYLPHIYLRYISAISAQARLAAEEERQNSARAKLLLCRTKMAWATFTARNKETLAVPWSAWQKLVRMGRVKVRVWAGLGLGLANPSPNPNSYP